MRRMLMLVVVLLTLFTAWSIWTYASRTEASAADSLRTVTLRIEGMT